jgi:conjugal transfer pilus assembly protein TraU
MRKFLIALILPFIVFGACKANPSTAVQIWMESLTTIYNIFPIRIAGVAISPIKLPDFNDVSSPICICMKGSPPIPRIGITVSLWEPIAFVETVKDPFCFPSLGVQLSLAGRFKENASQKSKAKSDVQTYVTYDAHWVKAHPFAWLNILLDFVCLEFEGLDIAYMTEIDPLWHNDIWAAILGPEALLVANPLAQMACIADSVAVNTADFPLDFLWWCQGSWGGSYPLTKHSQATNVLTASGATVGHLIMKMHRQLLLWGSIGRGALCGMYPLPLWIKSQYNLYPLYPFLFPKRFSIGVTNFLWGYGMNAPIINTGNLVWQIYRKRDCCAF